MTANEKWKIAILGELKSRSISEWFEKHMTLPCVLLSSMEKKDVTEELMVCPYCFEKTKIEYPTLKKHTVSRTCEHCQKEFENGCVTTDESTKAYFKVGRGYYRDNIIMTRANICGEDGILYIEVESVDLKYNVAKKRVVIKPNIIGYGFAFVGGRYRYTYGKASRARTANYSSYYHPEFFADESVLEFATEKEISNERILSDRNLMHVMYDLEMSAEKISVPGRSILARKARRFMDENPIVDLPIEIFNRHEYLILKLQKIDNLTHRFYYKGYCGSCGARYTHKNSGQMYSENKVHKCPKCGKGTMLFVEHDSNSKDYTVVDVLANKGIVIRRFMCYYDYKRQGIKIEAQEKDRIYINYSDNPEWRFSYIVKEGEDVWKIRKMDDIPYNYLKSHNLIVTERAEEFLKYTGFREFVDAHFRDDEPLHEAMTLKSMFYFLNACSTTTCLEKIAKLGWTKLCASYAEDITRENDIGIEPNARTIHEVLKLPKRLVTYITEHVNKNPYSSDVARIQSFYSIDENVMPEDLDWCTAHNVDPGNLRRIVRLLNISVHQAVEYLERVRVSQCFIPKSAVIEWYDYLNAAENIQADLSDKTVRYPSSLKREHDRASFKYQVIKDKNKEERFRKICKEYGETYSYESEKYQIVAPKDMQDLFEEGRRLNHCVGTYADRIAEGRTCVCFIRKKENPDQPYFTVEIAPDEERVRQIHGLSNRNVDRTRDHELYQFLKKWAKAKQINISAM